MKIKPSSSSRAGQRVTWVGAGWNAVLAGSKAVAGWLGHSQAMTADAVHSVSDLLTDLVVLTGVRLGRKAADEDHHFGHARIETLSAALVGISLLVVATFLAYQAISDIYHQREVHPNWLALAGAVLSLLVKESLYHYTARVGRRIKSPAVMANAWHHRSDALSSAAALLGIGGAMLNPAWAVLDSVAALAVCVLIAKVGVNVLWNATKEMTDTAPDPQVVENIRGCIMGVEGVLRTHDIKARTSGGLVHLHVHIVVDRTLRVHQGHRIAKEVESCLRDEFDDIAEIIVHVGPSEESRSSSDGGG